MKKISEEDFRFRLLEIQKATKIFVETGLTRNITHAFAVYQELLALDETPVFLSSDTVLDEKCPACGKTLKIKKACCNSTQMTKECVCGWKSYVE
jgi:predicted RNA-binding Zn-ribbon protein involved in translation (DUF1610 family)